MTRPTTSDGNPDDNGGALIRQFLAENPDADPRELFAAIADLGASRLHEFTRPPKKPLPRRTPPPEPTRYTLRVDIDDAKPPIWRRVSVPSDIRLDLLHEVLQGAIGWTNSHLHRFATSDDPYARTTEQIVTPEDIDEGDEGVLEETIRLDELVQAPGDTLHYTYDFGDDWAHTLKLEKAEPRAAGDDGCACLAGSRAAPPEDAGGIGSYEHMLEVADDPGHPDHADMVARREFYAVGDPAEFDLAAADRAVRRASTARAVRGWILLNADALPLALTELFDQLGDDAATWLAGFVGDARLDEPIAVTEEIALDSTRVIRTLLEHVGDGITLTAAGFLPPSSVAALMGQFDPDGRWLGQANRESQTYPLVQLRENVTRLGLLRKYRGRLLLTKAGRAGLQAPVDLWWHVARRLPLEAPDYGRDAATFLLLSLAAGEPASEQDLSTSLDLVTAMLGWNLGGTGRYGNASALRYVRDTSDVLAWAGSGWLLRRYHVDSAHEPIEHPHARLLARAALAPR